MTFEVFESEWQEWPAAHERHRADPPAENRLPVAIEAGEKIPYERQDQQ